MTDHKNHLAGLEPNEILLIADLETLKVVADPLRLQLLAQLRDLPQPAKQLARALDLPIKKLYYHLNLLEEHGLIRVAETRIISGIIEKHYRVTAYRLSVERELLTPQAEGAEDNLDVFLSLVLDHARAEIRRSVRSGLIDLADFAHERADFILGRHWLTLTASQATEYARRMKQIDIEFMQNPPPAQAGEEPRRYEGLLGLYPVLPPEERDR
jgi:DNA-binding transcriptional ArsR family regulator